MAQRHRSVSQKIALTLLLTLSVGISAQDRRRPGISAPRTDAAQLSDPNASSGLGYLAADTRATRSDFVALPDRWRLTKDLGLVTERWWDPYNRNILKADRPFYSDWFLDISVLADSKLKAQRSPTRTDAVGLSRPGIRRADLGRQQWSFAQTLFASATIFKGETLFRPPQWQLHAGAAINYSTLDVGARGVTHVRPRSSSTRSDVSIGLQSLSLRRHLRTVSANYDFDAIEIGVQALNLDPRGFVFFDNALAVRLFGTRDSNVWRYGISWARRFEKITDSGLNDTALRDEDIIAANVYRQDWPRNGLRTSISYLHHRDRESGVYVDDNGFRVRPSPAMTGGGEKIVVSYLGLGTEGPINRLNVSASLYKAIGWVSGSQLAEEDIDAWFAAVELSTDIDWTRIRASLLFSSGDTSASDRDRNGFDGVFDNPLFAGANTSYWIGESIPLLAGPRLSLSRQNSLIPSLRAPGPHGQSNFANPGLILAGVGADLDVLPTLRMVLNANRLDFHNTSSLELVSGLSDIDRGLGWDLSGALIFRPLLSQNAVVRLSGSILIPSSGLRALAGDNMYYAVQANVLLRY